MGDNNGVAKEKLSQKRVDRQLRKKQRREEKLSKVHSSPSKSNGKLVKVRHSKKSLPGFLAKNVDAILTWLKEYETLFVLADDYGFQRIDRLSPEKQAIYIDNYVQISEFITDVKDIIADEQAEAEAMKQNQQSIDESGTSCNDEVPLISVECGISS